MEKLIEIRHIRCGESCGTTYLLASADITEEQVQQDVDKAFEHYLKAKADFKKINPKTLYPSNKLESYPDNITIAEARRIEHSQKEEYVKWNEEERKASRSFVAYMLDLGYWHLCDSSDSLEVTVDWGHRHGDTLDMGFTETDCTRNKDDWDIEDLI